MAAIEDEPNLHEKRRIIRYADDDEEARDGPLSPGIGPANPGTRPALSRQMSNSSLASARSGIRSNPALAIPIEYRTLSFNIEDTRERQLADAKTAKEKATAGKQLFLFLALQLIDSHYMV